MHRQVPFKEGLCCQCRVAEQSGLFLLLCRLRPHSLNENFQKLITEKPSSSHCHYEGRGDGPADSQGSCREQGSDTLSRSSALIVQKMWFVPQLHVLEKVVFTVGGVPVAWIALLFNHPGILACVCAFVYVYVLTCLLPVCVCLPKCVLKVICTYSVCPSSVNKISKMWLPIRCWKKSLQKQN